MKKFKTILTIVSVMALSLVLLAGCNSKVESLNIKTRPTKTTFAVGEAFSHQGMVVEATHRNGRTRELAANKYEVDSSAFKSGTAGEYTITVSLKSDKSVKTTYKATVTGGETNPTNYSNMNNNSGSTLYNRNTNNTGDNRNMGQYGRNMYNRNLPYGGVPYNGGTGAYNYSNGMNGYNGYNGFNNYNGTNAGNGFAPYHGVNNNSGVMPNNRTTYGGYNNAGHGNMGYGNAGYGNTGYGNTGYGYNGYHTGAAGNHNRVSTNTGTTGSGHGYTGSRMTEGRPLPGVTGYGTAGTPITGARTNVM